MRNKLIKAIKPMICRMYIVDHEYNIFEVKAPEVEQQALSPKIQIPATYKNTFRISSTNTKHGKRNNRTNNKGE